MRDLILGLLLVTLTLASVRQPWLAVLGWTWVSMMNPHGLSWTLMNAPVAMGFAATTMISLVSTPLKRPLPQCRETRLLIAFMVWMTITLPFSFDFGESLELWKRVMKIDLMLLLSLMALYSRQHILAFTWVVAGSIAFYGAKGGLFTILTGGNAKVWGPSGGYIEGNNEIGLAIVMAIPLLRYLQTTLTGRWAKHAMTVTMLLCAAAALGTHSRGALLAIAAMAAMLWWRGRNRLIGLVVLPVIGVGMLSFMPDAWWERMGTIKTYQEDSSAMGRINAWWFAFNVAKSHFFGGGFSVTQPWAFAQYAPDPSAIHAAHSIYFMVLGEQGFIGLFLFLALFTCAFLSAGRLRTEARRQPETQWLSDLGGMCQVTLVGYAVGGAFLSLSYWDMPYNVMLIVIMGNYWMKERRWLIDPPAPSNPFEPLMFWRRKRPAALRAP